MLRGRLHLTMAVKPVKHRLEIVQGATLRESLTWKVGKPAVAVDLTGCTARLQVRQKIASPTVLLELTTENAGIQLGGTDGRITLSLSAAQTAAITWRTGVYDLEIVFGNGDVRRLLSGSAVVLPEITRSAQ